MDRSENAELTSRPRSPFSSSKFNSEIIVEHNDNDIQQITTIDWDCLKSVTMNCYGSDIPQRKPRKPKNSYKSNHLQFQKYDSTPVHASTLDSLRGLLGMKIMQEKECLNSLESAFPVANHDTSQMLQSTIYEHVSLLEK